MMNFRQLNLLLKTQKNLPELIQFPESCCVPPDHILFLDRETKPTTTNNNDNNNTTSTIRRRRYQK